MGDLTTEELGMLDLVGTETERRLVAEVRRHRATMRRLETWIEQMQSPAHAMNRYIVRCLQGRIKGDSNG